MKIENIEEAAWLIYYRRQLTQFLDEVALERMDDLQFLKRAVEVVGNTREFDNLAEVKDAFIRAFEAKLRAANKRIEEL